MYFGEDIYKKKLSRSLRYFKLRINEINWLILTGKVDVIFKCTFVIGNKECYYSYVIFDMYTASFDVCINDYSVFDDYAIKVFIHLKENDTWWMIGEKIYKKVMRSFLHWLKNNEKESYLLLIRKQLRR